MRKLLTSILLILALTLTFAACDPAPANDPPAANNPTTNDTPAPSNNTTNETPATPAETPVTPAETTPITGAINVISREDGSGTRGAFVELFDVRIENAEGRKVDDIRQDSDIQNSTGQVLTAVQGNKQAIGYISLGSLDNTVKALKIEGVDATPENVLNGTYSIARPFNIVTNSNSVLSEAAQDFMNFIMSDEGQAIIKAEKYISQGSTGAYTMSSASGTVKVEGSSSISPLMEKIKEAYEAINSNIKIEIQTNDSGRGVTATVEGSCDIGMVSREVRAEEVEQGLDVTAICIDGIAVIVNVDNPLSDVTKADIKEIYQDGGSITRWEEIG
ncbi:MAG: substrate-binding domain-containing protein [Oscillospiraceae bacterium]|nr:substrate-binding domain-containing protein [Oscillospiraceae bacterium]